MSLIERQGQIYDFASRTTMIERPRPSPSSWTPLRPEELEALRVASGKPVEPSSSEHVMHMDLETRGYLRRIVSFNREHYRRGDVGPRFAWTRTESGETLLQRLG